jgi:hypothetical protein
LNKRRCGSYLLCTKKQQPQVAVFFSILFWIFSLQHANGIKKYIYKKKIKRKNKASALNFANQCILHIITIDWIKKSFLSIFFCWISLTHSLARWLSPYLKAGKICMKITAKIAFMLDNLCKNDILRSFIQFFLFYFWGAHSFSK